MTWPFEGLQPFGYGVLMVDPPWQFKTYSDKALRSATRHYSTMTTEELCRLPVGHLAAKDCALLIWGTSPRLPDVLQCISAWGFQYKGKAFCWAKTNSRAEDLLIKEERRIDDPKNWFMGLGYSSRKNTEDCWLATTGNPKVLDRSIRELIVAPVREHSRKPDDAFERAGRLFAGPRAEIFSRQKRDGWHTWGNEIDKFPANANLSG